MKRIIFLLLISISYTQVNAQSTQVKADFEIDSTNKPFFKFTNTSTNAIQYRWTFLNISPRPEIEDNLTQLIISYDAAPCDSVIEQVGGVLPCTEKGMDFSRYHGWYYVCLEATGGYADKDTTCKRIYNKFKTVEKPKKTPIAFTPNGDGKSDFFDIEIRNYTKYELTIYNRWGEVVFESNDANYDWNGKVNNTGEDCPNGTYFWTLEFQLLGQEEKEMKGTCTLIR